MLTDEILLPLSIHPSQVDRALALGEPHYLRHRVLRRYMHVVRYQKSTLLLPCQPAKNLTQVLSQLLIQRLPASAGNEDHVVFALPLAVTWLPYSSILGTPFRVLRGSRLRVSAVDSRTWSRQDGTSLRTPTELSAGSLGH